MYSCYFWQEVISLSPDGPLHQPLVGLWDGQAMRRTFLADIQALDVALRPKVRRDLSGEKAQTVVAVSALHCEPWCRMCAISLCRLPLCSIRTFRTVMVNKYYGQIYSLHHLQLLFYVKTLFYMHISSENTFLSSMPMGGTISGPAVWTFGRILCSWSSLRLSPLSLRGIPLRLSGTDEHLPCGKSLQSKTGLWTKTEEKGI